MKKLVIWVVVVASLGIALGLPRGEAQNSTPLELSPSKTIDTFSVAMLEWNPVSDLIAFIPNNGPSYSTIILDPALVEQTSFTELIGPSGPVALAWSPDGQQIAIFEAIYNVQIWDVGAAEIVTTINTAEIIGEEGNAEFASLDWSPDGKQLVVGDGRHIGVLEISTHEFVYMPDEGSFTKTVAWSPSGEQIAISSDSKGSITILDSKTLQTVKELPFDGLPADPFTRNLALQTSQYIAWSPDGDRIASFHTRREDGVHQISIMDTTTGEILAILEGHKDEIQAIAWSPDGSKLASASGSQFPDNNGDNTIRIWDMNSYEQLYILQGHTDLVSSVTWSPDGTQVASGSWDGTIRIWDIPQS